MGSSGCGVQNEVKCGLIELALYVKIGGAVLLVRDHCGRFRVFTADGWGAL
jgi:hypothetical protein